MWKYIDRRSEIISITNGVHLDTWGDKKIIEANKRGENLWDYHMNNKQKLIDFIYEEKDVKLDKNKLLIGFARRAAPYKRGDLIFTDEERIAPLLKNGDIQIIISSKAHPLDFTGKEIIKHILSIEKKYPNSVVFLDNYNMKRQHYLQRV
jgi:starch phosphorylase